MLWLKSRSARGASIHRAFIGNCPTISHKCQPLFPRRWVLLFVSGEAEQDKNAE